MNKKAILAIVILLLGTAPIVSAGIFDWLKLPSPVQTQPKLAYSIKEYQSTEFFNLYTKIISPLNTPQNIKNLGNLMDSYKVSVIKVHVTDLNNDFYVLAHAGTTTTPPRSIDATTSLTSGQIKRIVEMLQDNEISSLEKLQLYTMIKWQ